MDFAAPYRRYELCCVERKTRKGLNQRVNLEAASSGSTGDFTDHGCGQGKPEGRYAPYRRDRSTLIAAAVTLRRNLIIGSLTP